MLNYGAPLRHGAGSRLQTLLLTRRASEVSDSNTQNAKLCNQETETYQIIKSIYLVLARRSDCPANKNGLLSTMAQLGQSQLITFIGLQHQWAVCPGVGQGRFNRWSKQT